MFRSKWIPYLAGAGVLVTSVAGCEQSKTQPDESAAKPATPAASATTDESHATLSDVDITAAVERRLLSDGTVHDGNIAVKTTDGVVQLIGKTDNLITKKRAELLASTVKGVRSISNRIQIDTPKRADGDIETEVKHALMFDAAAEAYEIDVGVKQQVVTLEGKVQSWQERRLAERIAEGVRGVKRVDNEIEVQTAKQRPDTEILADVQSRLQWDALVDQGMLEANVKDGVVTLSGVVGSLAEKLHARADAWGISGVKDVNDDAVNVKWWAKRSDLRANLPTYAPDSEIESALKDALLVDPRVSSFDVDVAVDAGIVTLKGTVSSLKAKKAAENLARDTTGVSGVKNQISVDMPKAPSDAELTKRAESTLLFNPNTSAFGISVAVKDGVATLTGSVDTFAEKAEAEDAISAIAGITKVDNELEVKTPVAFVFEAYSYPYAPLVDEWVSLRPEKAVKTDAEIQKAIADELFWSPFFNAADINVKVENGVAKLTGTVDTFRGRNAATASAYEGGATVVDNELKVK